MLALKPLKSANVNIVTKNLPDGSISLETEPLGKRSVLLGGLGQLELGLERLLGLHRGVSNKNFNCHKKKSFTHTGIFSCRGLR
jgi:hypothetical protein